MISLVGHLSHLAPRGERLLTGSKTYRISISQDLSSIEVISSYLRNWVAIPCDSAMTIDPVTRERQLNGLVVPGCVDERHCHTGASHCYMCVSHKRGQRYDG
jgi:hypothetical protein